MKEKDRPPPRSAARRSEMRDLSQLFRKNTLTLILSQVFTGTGPIELRASIFLKVFVRVVDKALEDYELSRTTFLQFVNRQDNSVLGPLFTAMGHMENTLSSLGRASKYVNRLLDDQNLKHEIGEMQFMRKDSQRRLRIIRNATEHMDDRVIKGTVGNEDLNGLWLDEEYMELQGEKITYNELAIWLEELHSLAKNLATYQQREQQSITEEN